MLLELPPIRAPRPRLDKIDLGSAIGNLHALRRPDPSLPGTVPPGSREQEMIERLTNRRPHETFADVTKGIGRERILLNLYVAFSGRNDAAWLPPFDTAVATSILGVDGRGWPKDRRRQATQLFFTHFDRLPALDTLCERLVESYDPAESNTSGLITTYPRDRHELFSRSGPESLAAAAQPGEPLEQLMDRFAVPRAIGTVQLSGRFASKLKECYLFSRLQAVELGTGHEILREIEAVRELPYQPGVPIGAVALRILTRRTLAEGGIWKGDWANWLLKLGSDPALPNSAEYRKWWACWNPTPDELECARRGLDRETLEYFIRFLDSSLSGVDGRDQFRRRARFLRWLDESGKIKRFKLLLHPNAFDALPREYRQRRSRVARLDGSHTGASVIVFECSDEVWIVEGTHSFAIRMFRGHFPERVALAQDWQRYDYDSFTQGPMHKDAVERNGIYKRHQGDWESDLIRQMREKFHIEPPWRYR